MSVTNRVIGTITRAIRTTRKKKKKKKKKKKNPKESGGPF
jgi:hypothetical protein